MSTATPTPTPAAAPAAPPPAAAPAAPAAPQFPPAPAGHCNVVVDGHHVVAKNGENLIEAAKRANVEIPYFCYHPKLSIAGQCRMCLVETSDRPGWLVAGCQIRVREGLKIITDTPAIKENQRACMEFHLVNHPVDCPICDQSGECKLQDYYMAYDHQSARIGTYKLGKPKRKTFGPLVVYDGERCILCTRCVRFMNEIAHEPQLAMVGRGDHSEIDVMPGRQLDSKYSGNTVDICPVGALLNRDFRFSSRVWYLDNKRTVCDGCANGCNTGADVRGDVVYRLLPKRNEAVNDVWLCDDGRTSYHRAHENRVTGPRVGRGESAEFPWSHDADKLAVDVFKGLQTASGAAVAISATLGTEEAFAAAAFAKDVLGLKKVYGIGRPSGTDDDFLIRADKNPNTQGLTLAAKAAGIELASFDQLQKDLGGAVKALVLFGTELPKDEAAFAAKLGALETVVAFAVTTSAVTEQATLLLPLASHYESAGSFVNYGGRLQVYEPVIAPQHGSSAAYAYVTVLSVALGRSLELATADAAFAALSGKSPAFLGLSRSDVPKTGTSLAGLAPKEWPKRAPRPAEGATA